MQKKTFVVAMIFIQVNICQKHLFLHQLTHNMTTDCSLNYVFSTWNSKLRTLCVYKLFWTWKQKSIWVHNIFSTCSVLGIFIYWARNSMKNNLSYCGLVDSKMLLKKIYLYRTKQTFLQQIVCWILWLNNKVV